jgi:hypothetical protein
MAVVGMAEGRAARPGTSIALILAEYQDRLRELETGWARIRGQHAVAFGAVALAELLVQFHCEG